MLMVTPMRRKTETILEYSLLSSSPMMSVKVTNLHPHHDRNILYRQEAGPPGLASVSPTPTATPPEVTETDPVRKGSESAACSSRRTAGPR